MMHKMTLEAVQATEMVSRVSGRMLLTIRGKVQPPAPLLLFSRISQASAITPNGPAASFYCLPLSTPTVLASHACSETVSMFALQARSGSTYRATWASLRPKARGKSSSCFWYIAKQKVPGSTKFHSMTNGAPGWFASISIAVSIGAQRVLPASAAHAIVNSFLHQIKNSKKERPVSRGVDQSHVKKW